MKTSLKEAALFEKKYRGPRLFVGTDAKGLSVSIREKEAIQEKADKTISYAYLVFAADTQNPRH